MTSVERLILRETLNRPEFARRLIAWLIERPRPLSREERDLLIELERAVMRAEDPGSN